jgi:hypothetical protein
MKKAWDGEYYYASFGEDPLNSWNDACRHGFISEGGGSSYTQTLNTLGLGDRGLVNIPRKGHVGAGRVTEKLVPFDKFFFST